MINHFGSMAAGHYTAACRVPLGKGKEDWCGHVACFAAFCTGGLKRVILIAQSPANLNADLAMQ